MRREKGMTLVELLIAMGLSVLIMAATVVLIRYSAATYDDTTKMVQDNNNTYDAVSIINHYIRTASFCTVSQNGKNLYVTVDEAAFGGTAGYKQTIYFSYDEDDAVLYIDRMDGTPEIIVAESVSDIEWHSLANGVKYIAYTRNANGVQEKLFSGYAYKRGR